MTLRQKVVLQCTLFPLLVWAIVPRSVLVSRIAVVSYGVTLKTPEMLGLEMLGLSYRLA